MSVVKKLGLFQCHCLLFIVLLEISVMLSLLVSSLAAVYFLGALVQAQTPQGYTPNTTVPLYLKYPGYPVVKDGSVLPYNRTFSVQNPLPSHWEFHILTHFRSFSPYRTLHRTLILRFRPVKRNIPPLPRRCRFQQIRPHSR